MPLGSLFALHWYGPAAGAAVGTGATAAGVADLRAVGRLGAIGGGSGAAVLAKATRLRNSPAIGFAGGAGVLAAPRARARMGAIGRIGALSQDDVTGAVLEARVEGDLTLKQALRLLLAQAAGNATGLDGGAVVFRSLDGSKTRVAGTVAAGVRTVTVRDGD